MTEHRENNEKRSVLRSLLGPAVALLVGLVLVALVTMLPGRAEPEAAVDEPVVNVVVQEVRPVAELHETMTHKAVAVAWAWISLSAETEGRIVAIEADEGDMISPGQTLVRLDDALQQAEYRQALVQAELDQREADRTADAAGAASRSEKDIAASTAAASAARLASAEARLDRTRINAPRAIADPSGLSTAIGRLENLPVEIGEFVSAGAQVAVLLDCSALKVVVDAPERDIRYISLGQDAEVVIEALGERRVAGKVHFIENDADAATRTYRVEIKIANPDGEIRPGMFARVTLGRRTLSNAIMIPLDAAIPLERGYEVYVDDGGVARRRVVRLTGDLIRANAAGVTEILVRPPLDPADGPGLQPGDRLIVSGQRLVSDGQRIAVQPALSAQRAD